MARKTMYSFDTVYSADSVEWCPYEPYTSILATGTYQVNKLDKVDKDTEKIDEASEKEDGSSPETERLGRIYLHRAEFAEDGELNGVDVIQTFDVDAVLDMKWGWISNLPVLAVADASGCVSFYKIESKDGKDSLVMIHSLKISDGLALALDFCKTEKRLSVSDSRGRVSVVDVQAMEVTRVFDGHSFEAWTTCFTHWDTNVLFSGGDDCCFRQYDLRVEGNLPSKSNSKTHGMGVTAMVEDSVKEWQLYSGSYDEAVRTWDHRNLKYEVGSVGVGGGVWRIKQRPKGGTELLVAAMHDGFKVVGREGGVKEYTEHASLAYGADWCCVEAKFPVVATCSFYDHLLRVWDVDLESVV